MWRSHARGDETTRMPPMADTGKRRDDWRTTSPNHPGRPAAGKGKGKTGRRIALAAVVVALLVGLVLSLPLFVNKHS